MTKNQKVEIRFSGFRSLVTSVCVDARKHQVNLGGHQICYSNSVVLMRVLSAKDGNIHMNRKKNSLRPSFFKFTVIEWLSVKNVKNVCSKKC